MSHLTLIKLPKTLILAGMESFLDFFPYISERHVILSAEKFVDLPIAIQTKLQTAFKLREHSDDEFLGLNEAIVNSSESH